MFNPAISSPWAMGGLQAYHDKAWNSKNKTPEFLRSDAPARLDDFQQRAQEFITQGTLGAYRENAATQTGIFRDTQRQMGDQFAMLGLNPAAAVGRFIPQQNMQFAGALGGLRGGAEAQQAQGQMDLSGQVTNALNQIEAYYDSLNFQKWATDKAGKEAARARKSGLASSLIGGVGSVAGGFAGGLGLGMGGSLFGGG